MFRFTGDITATEQKQNVGYGLKFVMDVFIYMHIGCNIFLVFSLKKTIGMKRNGVYFKTNFFCSEIHVGSVFKSDNIILPRTHPQDVSVAPGDRVLFV
jgi:hypothetical protein